MPAATYSESRFPRLSAFVRYGGDGHAGNDAAGGDDESDADASPLPRTQIFTDVGAGAYRIRTDLNQVLPITTSPVLFGPHLAVGVRREVSPNNDWGVRLELDQVNGHSLIGARPIDYRHRYGDTFALSWFAGVDRYDLATPAYSLYGGMGAEWRDVWLPQWDVGVDLRYAQNIARNRVLPTDVTGPRPDSFYKIQSLVGYVSRRF